MVLGLTCKSFNHFEFIVVNDVTKWSGFIMFACIYAVLPTTCIEETVFAPLHILASTAID